MTTSAMRVAGILVLAYLIGACTRVGHIQRNEPVRMMTFAGSYQAVAQCTQQRLSARLQADGADRVVVYDSTKSKQAEGFTHYAISFGKASEKESFAEMRVQRSPVSPGPGQPSGGRVPLSRSAVDEFWKAVVDCAAQARRAT
jgi:hypothetical protein